MARIVSLGSALQDVYLVDHDDLVPTKIGDTAIFGKVLVGSKVDIDKIQYGVGGGGVNSAIEFSRHGHESILISAIGHDLAGDAIMRTLDHESVDTSYIHYEPRTATGTSVVLLDSKTGERTILTYRGASKNFYNFDAKDLNLIQPDWLYITTLRGNLETLLSFVATAKKLGTKVAYNPGVKELENAKDLIKIIRAIDVLILNKSEAAALVPGTNLLELVGRLNNYVETVIVTDSAMGGIAANRQECYRFGIYEDVPVKDTTGAGDAFGSGFIAHLAAGKSFKSSIEYGSANSTSVIQKIGANKGMLTGSERLHPMPIQKI